MVSATVAAQAAVPTAASRRGAQRARVLGGQRAGLGCTVPAELKGRTAVVASSSRTQSVVSHRSRV